ncbi:MAG: hypothetical protein K2K31_02325 [Clostridia bacterium]|nr:hypothetical protein [Clostridia bacterium]
MKERVCKNCGGRQYKVVGQNMVKCMFCGTLYVDEQASKEEEVLIVGANEKLRDLKFKEAVDEFNKILLLFPFSFAGYYGRALATSKIVLYSNNKNMTKRPRFFGEDIPSLSNNSDFKRALELAPAEIAKTYNALAKRVDKIRKAYRENKDKVDVVLSAVDNAKAESIVSDITEKLEEHKFKTYFVPEVNELEEITFNALQRAKVLLVFVTEGNIDSTFRSVYERYLYFISQRKKTKTSFIVVLDQNNVDMSRLPLELQSSKNVLDLNSDTLLFDIQVMVGEEMKKSASEIAKIDTIKVDKVQPKKKKYVNTDAINPSDLGHYHVENVEITEEGKIKWIYLSLKNGDFATAEEVLNSELENDANNAELLLAQLMLSRQVKTKEEFFENISNFKDTESIDKILQCASKSFAEDFVDRVEDLVISLHDVGYYNTYLLYLAKYNSPNRQHFVDSAKTLAVESMDEELIEKVLRCFKKSDVDGIVAFYFDLAQKSDNKKYYDKILEIDEGHAESNYAVLFEHFKTDKDLLSYQNRDELESVFKFLNGYQRDEFISRLINMILDVAFIDLEKCENQIDFYLSYVSDNKRLVSILKNISQKFLDLEFFTQSEKYISIAITKDKKNAELFWLLILSKSHCRKEQELITSNIKITQMPEWSTLLTLANEEQSEKYAGIVSKMNLYKGDKKDFKEEALDKAQYISKTNEFLDRNYKILLEMEKQEGVSVLRGVNYYRLQLQPFEQYVKMMEEAHKYEEFNVVVLKINERLKNMDLTFEASINVSNLIEKEEHLTLALGDADDVKEEKHRKTIKDLKKDVFLKRFLLGFLIYFPVLFTTVLLITTLSAPKEVYMSFSYNFLVCTLIYSVAIAFVNLVYLFIKKKTLNLKMKLINISLIAIGLTNALLLLFGFYVFPVTMDIKNADEFNTLLHNAGHASYVITEDIDMNDIKWNGVNFTGKLDGNGKTLRNVKFSENSNGLFATNSGTISNLKIIVANETYKDIKTFGVVAGTNVGTIQDCTVSGEIAFDCNIDAVIGGLVGNLKGGTIANCSSNLVIKISVENCKLSFGGVSGKVFSGKKQSVITKCSVDDLQLNVTANQAKDLEIGGLVGFVDNMPVDKVSIGANKVNLNSVVKGKASNLYLGGLIGDGEMGSANNYTLGQIDVQNYQGEKCVGGLYGRMIVASEKINDTKISTSYSCIEITADNDYSNVGSLVGRLGGEMENCFSTTSVNVFGNRVGFGSADNNCDFNVAVYNNKYKFSNEIWDFSQTLPTLK